MTGDRVLDWFITYYLWRLSLVTEPMTAHHLAESLMDVWRKMPQSERSDLGSRRIRAIGWRERQNSRL